MCDEIVSININNDGASSCSGAEKIRRPSDRFDDVSEGAHVKFALIISPL